MLSQRMNNISTKLENLEIEFVESSSCKIINFALIRANIKVQEVSKFSNITQEK